MAPAAATASGERGLKSLVWQKLKTSVFDDCRKEEEWKIILLDDFTTKLLSSCGKMTDLLAEGITVVENVYKNREPVPHMKAIYLITPTTQSVDGLINDFVSKSSSKYKAAYVYFTDFCDDKLFNRMKSSCSKAIRRCKEININFFPYESQVFTLDVPNAFYHCYSPIVEKANETVMEQIADQIVTLCATLEENPGVRYKSKPLDNASKLAQLVEKKLENYYKMDERGKVKGKTHSQLLIIDRGFDPVSTVLHELTFQAMAYDLLPIENDTYKYKTEDASGKEREAILEEDDDLWVKIRHKHIADVLEEIPKLMKEVSSKRKATEGKQTLSNLAQLMKKMPYFRKQITKVVHLNIAEDCMNKFKNNVEKLCKVEQDLALGADAEGQRVRDSMQVLLPVLLNKNHDSYDKIRAILLYIFSTNGTTQETLDKLIQKVQIENDSDMIKNWKHLGVPILTTSTSQQRKSSRRNRSSEETYQLSRWTPMIKDVMEDTIENKLDSKEWPYCSQCPAPWNGSGAVSARNKPKTSHLDERKSGSKLIVFVIGGITYSEMRCAYEVSQAYKSCEVIIGSTHIITPRRLLDDIKALTVPKSKDTVYFKNE
ncbi:syntaxin-binding protein 3 isoform X2 [Anolis carolinensis]|uniref:syntaxin-binding protein 3 isoform X2 n=1 Tax=Anolis carolinensis TaxID=28377 RepID=UPI002F2B1933